jgi:hypothetical protein
MANPLILLIGCDCDPDRPRYGGSRYDVYRSPQQWKGIEEGIRRLQEELGRLEQRIGLKPKVIFCVRADLQMKEIYGSAGSMVESYLPLWRELAKEGHEVAWHPHLWRWSGTWGCWYQETEDNSWISMCLEIGFSGFLSAWGKAPSTCHMGWTFHNNISMQAINRLGVKMDFSASPGVFFEGGPGAAGTAFDNQIDWRGTPKRWYRPSVMDYRRPRRGDETELDVIEIPKFTSESGLLTAAKRLAYGLKKRTLSAPASAAFLQVTAQPVLYNHIVRERLECTGAEPFLVTYFHPDELIERKLSPQDLLYSRANFSKNILHIVKKATEMGRDIRFATGAEALGFVREQL